MKKGFLLLILLGLLIQSCRKEDEIDYANVKTIIINGSFLNDKTSEPIKSALPSTWLYQKGRVFYRIPNSYRIIDGKIEDDGTFEIRIDTVDVHIEKKSINLVAYLNLYNHCDSNLNRCSREPAFKLPFSMFKQKLEGSTLFLSYDIRVHEMGKCTYDFTNIMDADSVRIEYDARFICNRKHDFKISNFTNIGSFKLKNDNWLFGLGQFIPNEDYTVIFSKMKGGKVTNKIEWKGRLNPVEDRIVKLKFD
jgi:hypothetical protein